MSRSRSGSQICRLPYVQVLFVAAFDRQTRLAENSNEMRARPTPCNLTHLAVVPHECPSTEGWMHLPPELRARANAFRTKETHLFMLGQKVPLKAMGSKVLV